MKRIGGVTFAVLSLLLPYSASAETAALPQWDDEVASQAASPDPNPMAYQKVIFEGDNLIAYEGMSCINETKLFSKPIKDAITKWPDYVNQATIYQNGFWMKYIDGDHAVRIIQSSILYSRFSPGVLEWIYSARMTDEQNNPSQVCGSYIAIGWNSQSYNDQVYAGVVHGQAAGPSMVSPVMADELTNMMGPRSTLPHGFTMRTSWNESRDIDLYEAGYSIGLRESGHFLHETSLAMLKDAGDTNIDAHDYNGGLVRIPDQQPHTILNSADPLELKPAYPSSWGGCIQPSGTAAVETSPFTEQHKGAALALPVLTGWHLQFGACEREHVKEIGVWVHDVSYQSDGTLTYQVSHVLRDNNGDPQSWRKFKVHALIFWPPD